MREDENSENRENEKDGAPIAESSPSPVVGSGLFGIPRSNTDREKYQ